MPLTWNKQINLTRVVAIIVIMIGMATGDIPNSLGWILLLICVPVILTFR